MKNFNKKTFLKILTVTGASLLTAIPVTNSILQFSRSQTGVERDRVEISDNAFLNQKNKYGTTSCEIGYFQFLDKYSLRFCNYDNQEIWRYDVRSTETVNFNGQEFQKGGYANPFAFEQNNQANSSAVLLDAEFNSDFSKLLILSGVEKQGQMYMSLFQIDVKTGLPWINNANTPQPSLNSAYSNSTNGNALLTYSVSGNSYPFITISNDKACVMVNDNTNWLNNKLVDLDTYITDDITFSLDSGTQFSGYTPYAFANMGTDKKALLLSNGTKLGWVKLNDKYQIQASSEVLLANTYSNLYIGRYNPQIFPYPFVSNDGNMYIVSAKSNFYLKKFAIDNNTELASFTLSSYTWKIKSRAETNTAIVSDVDGIKVINLKTNTIVPDSAFTFPSGMTNRDFQHAEFQLINSTFDSAAGDFNGGTGATFSIGNENYLIKIKSDFSQVLIEQVQRQTIKNSQELFINSDVKYKLANTIKFDDIKPFIGFVDDQSSGSNQNIILVNQYGNEVSNPGSNPIYTYYSNNVTSSSTSLSFNYNIEKTSWWNSTEKIKYTNNQVTLNGFSTSTDYYVAEKSGANWNGKNYLASGIQVRTVLENLQFGVDGKNKYPIQSKQSSQSVEDWVQQNKTYFVDDGLVEKGNVNSGFSFPSGKYIKLYADDVQGTLSIQYDFSAIADYFGSTSNLNITAIKGIINISGFKTQDNYNNFYPSEESVKTLLTSNYAYNIDKNTILNSIIPKNIASGYINPHSYAGNSAWRWVNLLSGDVGKISDNVNKPVDGGSVTYEQCLWNNWLAGYIEYTGPLGTDIYDGNYETRRIFIIPEIPSSVPTTTPGSDYSITLGGQLFEGKTYDSSRNSGDMFINSQDLIRNQTVNSIIDKISGQASGATFDSNEAFKNNGTIASTIKENITQEDIEKVQAGDNQSIIKIKNILFTSSEGNPPVSITNSWIDYRNVDISFENKQEPQSGNYYFTYDLVISIPLSAQTNITYNGQKITVQQLGEQVRNSDPNIDAQTVFYIKESVEILDINSIYNALKLQQSLIDKGVTLTRNDSNFESSAELKDYGTDFFKENNSISPSTYLEKIKNKENSDVKVYAENVNNSLTFLDSSATYNNTTNKIFQFENVNIVPDNYNGDLVLTFTILFNDPTSGSSLPINVGREVVSFRLHGFYSYQYELIMWTVFAATLFIIILLIVLLVIYLRKERNKNRLWNIKK